MPNMKAVLIAPASPLDTAQIPGHVARNLAQVAHKAILRDWSNPEIRADFERWKAEGETRTGKR